MLACCPLALHQHDVAFAIRERRQQFGSKTGIASNTDGSQKNSDIML
jgi:hypothetical protein